jgi:hypothetical protein
VKLQRAKHVVHQLEVAEGHLADALAELAQANLGRDLWASQEAERASHIAFLERRRAELLKEIEVVDQRLKEQRSAAAPYDTRAVTDAELAVARAEAKVTQWRKLLPEAQARISEVEKLEQARQATRNALIEQAKKIIEAHGVEGAERMGVIGTPEEHADRMIRNAKYKKRDPRVMIDHMGNSPLEKS